LSGIGEDVSGEIDPVGEDVSRLKGDSVEMGEGENLTVLTRSDLLLSYMNIATVFSMPDATMSLDLPDIFK